MKVIKYLIEERKVDINIKDTNGWNALMFACAFNQNLEVVKYLVEQRIYMNLLDVKKRNCLQLACSSNQNVKVIKYLVE